MLRLLADKIARKTPVGVSKHVEGLSDKKLAWLFCESDDHAAVGDQYFSTDLDNLSQFYRLPSKSTEQRRKLGRSEELRANFKRQ